jgi:uncharacterized membrane-anchored protein
MRETIFLWIVMLCCCTIRANTGDPLQAAKPSLQYETGVVCVANGIAQLTIPTGYKFLNAEQSKYIISEVWHRWPQPDLAGMLFPESQDPFVKDSYAFVINYEPRGHVKDGDAHQIDYDQVLRNMQRNEADENGERKKMGYESIHIVRWAQQPVYDKYRHILSWAKQIQTGLKKESSFSYNIRVLGRNGIVSLTAETSSAQQPLLKDDMQKLMHIVSFSEGNTYVDFNAKSDKVASWTIGTLITGKIVTKTNIFALLGKYLNLIVSGVAIVTLLIANLLKHRANGRQFCCEMGLACEEIKLNA